MLGRRFTAACAAVGCVLLSAVGVNAQVYTNGVGINVPAVGGGATSGPGGPFPSQIVVTGGPTAVVRMQVNLISVSHEFVGDVVVLLVAPNGARIKLMETGSSQAVEGLNISFASNSSVSLPSTPVTGVFRPTGGSFAVPNSGGDGVGDGNFDNVLGSNSNGTWSLYVYDRGNGDIGYIAAWSLDFTGQPLIDGSFVYQGRLDGVAPGSAVNVRLSAWNSLTGTIVGNRFAGPVTVTTTVAPDGTVTVPVAFGTQIPADRESFLQIEVASPPQSGFVTLSPRQRFAPAPIASNSARLDGLGSASFARVDQVSTFVADQTFTTGKVLSFGAIGNRAGSAENTDYVAFNRVNVSSNITDMRLILGDDPTGSVDSFSIGTSNNGTNFDARFIFKTDGNAFKPGGGSWTTTSDRRLKHDIMPLEGSLDRLLGLRGVTFAYNDPKRAGACEGTMMGFIAQDVEPIFPRWVSTDAEGYKAITITGFEALTVEALRELRAEKDAQIAEKDAEIADLRDRVEDLYERLERLEIQRK